MSFVFNNMFTSGVKFPYNGIVVGNSVCTRIGFCAFNRIWIYFID